MNPTEFTPIQRATLKRLRTGPIKQSLIPHHVATAFRAWDLIEPAVIKESGLLLAAWQLSEKGRTEAVKVHIFIAEWSDSPGFRRG